MNQAVHHALFYDYVEDVVEKRAPHREAHLALARQWKDEAKLVAGGALGDPPHGGLLVFAVDDAAEAERFASLDPYVENGIVTSWRVGALERRGLAGAELVHALLRVGPVAALGAAAPPDVRGEHAPGPPATEDELGRHVEATDLAFGRVTRMRRMPGM